MRILQINKFFYRRGGAEAVFFDTIGGLRARGHEVSEFAMQDPRNAPSQFAAYFASAVPELLGNASATQQWRIFRRLFRSREIERKLRTLVLAAEPEVAHIHNAYHHLSAGSFLELRRLGVPIVLTLHDVFPLCPNHSLLKGETLGEKYFKNKLYNCARYRCIDNRFWPSLAGTLEAYYYRYRQIWDSIKIFICPSEFMKNKMVEYGFPAEKMRVIRNPFNAEAPDIPPRPLVLGNKIVYLGRIHYEKGIKIFIEAAKELRDFPTIIAGSGPDDRWLNDFIVANRLSQIDRRGWVSGESWRQVMAEARVVVAPSVFLENCSLTILEALGWGRLVVAADRGGNRELIIDGVTGFLAKPENPPDLAKAIRRAMTAPARQAEAIIKQGRSLVASQHNPEQYFNQLTEIYRELSAK